MARLDLTQSWVWTQDQETSVSVDLHHHELLLSMICYLSYEINQMYSRTFARRAGVIGAFGPYRFYTRS